MAWSVDRKKRRLVIVVAVLLVLLLAAAGVVALRFGVFAPASAPETSSESESSVVSSSSSDQPSVVPSVSSSESSKESVPPDPMTDEELFTDTAFIGNSCAERLFLQGFARQAEFLTRTGLNVKTVFTTPSTRGSIPIVDELSSGKQYKRIFILFGSNELGWDRAEDFIAQYGLLIDAVKERQPGAVIYVQSIPPVTHKADARNTYNVNNTRIDEYNILLSQLAPAKGAKFLDIASALRGEDGALPDEASTDGIHLSVQYSEKWIEYIRQNVTE